MPKKISSILMFLFLSINLFGANSPRVSVLICGTGDDLYSMFGHSAIRIRLDTSDVVYNFGTFDFNTPDFRAKFIKGDLNYFLSKNSFSNFLNEYINDRRSVIEYPLALTSIEALSLKNSLERIHSDVTSRRYRYQFLRDNCATRIYTLLKNNIRSYNWPLRSYPTTFRSSLNENLDNNSTSRFGINILMGALGEKKLNSTTNSFLPDSLAAELRKVSSKTDGKSLLEPANILFNGAPKTSSRHLPEIVLLTAIIIFMVLSKFRSQAIINVGIGTVLIALMIFSFRAEFMFNYCILIFNPLDILLFCKIGKFKNNLLLTSLVLNIVYVLIYVLLNINYLPLLVLNVFILLYKLRIYLKINWLNLH